MKNVQVSVLSAWQRKSQKIIKRLHFAEFNLIFIKAK